jgi:hypothetical protein
MNKNTLTVLRRLYPCSDRIRAHRRCSGDQGRSAGALKGEAAESAERAPKATLERTEPRRHFLEVGDGRVPQRTRP